MSKNLIPVIAECLGVRIGEEFDVNVPYMGKARYCRYKLTDRGLLRKDGDWIPASGFLEGLVCGDFEISKLPYEPKVNDVYWTYAIDIFEPVSVVWLNYATDYARKLTGIVFRTEEEAIEARAAKYKELTGKEWESR